MRVAWRSQGRATTSQAGGGQGPNKRGGASRQPRRPRTLPGLLPCPACSGSGGPAAPSAPLRCRSDAFFCFHTINAFEAGGGLVVDLCGYDEVSWLHTFRLPHLRSGKATPPAVDIRRWGPEPRQAHSSGSSWAGQTRVGPGAVRRGHHSHAWLEQVQQPTCPCLCPPPQVHPARRGWRRCRGAQRSSSRNLRNHCKRRDAGRLSDVRAAPHQQGVRQQALSLCVCCRGGRRGLRLLRCHRQGWRGGSRVVG